MVAERVVDPFGSAPYVDSLFAGDVKKANVAKTLAIPVPRDLVASCLGVTLSV